MKTMTAILAISGTFIISSHGQGFLNLDFESAHNLPANPGNGEFVSVTNALPDWSADYPFTLANVFYVSNSISGFGSPVELEGGSLALSGSYSVALDNGASIGQTGMVPYDAESLDFEGEGPGFGGSIRSGDLTVTLGGQNLSFSALYDGPDYIEYGANIPTDMDGQTEELMFLNPGNAAGVLLDDIQFSSSAAPEPGELALIGLGITLFGLCRRKY